MMVVTERIRAGRGGVIGGGGGHEWEVGGGSGQTPSRRRGRGPPWDAE